MMNPIQHCTNCDTPIYDWADVDGAGRCNECHEKHFNIEDELTGPEEFIFDNVVGAVSKKEPIEKKIVSKVVEKADKPKKVNVAKKPVTAKPKVSVVSDWAQDADTFTLPMNNEPVVKVTIQNQKENDNMTGIYEGTINLINVLLAVGYSPVSVKGQKTKLVKAGLGLDAEEAKVNFLFTKDETLQVLGQIMKSKSEKSVKATEIFDLMSKDKFEADWTAEYVAPVIASGAKKAGAAKKGTLADYKEFAIASGQREAFVKFMREKHGEGTVVAEWE
ncbi:MAG: hypothetical protein ACRC0V_10970 [Fusobacteriaceae bacterium]